MTRDKLRELPKQNRQYAVVSSGAQCSFEDGVIPESEGKVVPYLVIEADGVGSALLREEERRAEINVGIAHEGWQQISRERYRLKEKSVYSGIMSGDRF